MVSFAPAGAASAESSTPTGAISVAQVVQMLDQAPTNRTARQVLTAYLAGVGKAAGVVISAGAAPCQKPLTLSTHDARQALSSVTKSNAGDVAATPLIVHDLLVRAGCRSR